MATLPLSHTRWRPGDTVKTTENNIPIPSPQTTAMVGNNFNEITLGFTLTQRG
jgi:hypothetical protein